MYTKLYPIEAEVLVKDMIQKNDVQKWLIGLLRDPIAKTLMKNSNLTKTQIETFLIDILAEKITGKKIIFEKKAELRLLKSGVSRGAFNRTLAQARKNIIKSIYTIILLGYLGVFDSPRLDPYLEIANKLHTYAEAYRDAWKKKKVSSEHLRIINMLQREIENGLKQLSEPNSMSDRL